MTRSFASLSAPQALRAAIAVEERNTELYRNLADCFQSYNAALADVFKSMAAEEADHRISLETYLHQQFPDEPDDCPPIEVRDVIEAPDLPDPELFIFDETTVQQAVEMAEQTEARACEFYQRMAREVSDDGLRPLCEYMADVEAGHRETFSRWKKY